MSDQDFGEEFFATLHENLLTIAENTYQARGAASGVTDPRPLGTAGLELALTEFTSPEGVGIQLVTEWTKMNAARAAYHACTLGLPRPRIADGKVEWTMFFIPWSVIAPEWWQKRREASR